MEEHKVWSYLLYNQLITVADYQLMPSSLIPFTKGITKFLNLFTDLQFTLVYYTASYSKTLQSVGKTIFPTIQSSIRLL